MSETSHKAYVEIPDKFYFEVYYYFYFDVTNNLESMYRGAILVDVSTLAFFPRRRMKEGTVTVTREMQLISS
jgi:hypothetical protein